MAKSLITCEIDLTAPGRQAGYLRVPHSVHRSAYGWIGLPIVSIKHGPGPVVLMLGGVHGDEYEGQVALSRLARALAPGEMRGQLIVLPAVNAPAAAAGQRVSPVDGGNLNRAFPGDAAGTPTEMIAHFIEEDLLPRCDLLIDLHSGGSSLYYPATLLRGPGADAAEAETLQRLQDAFDLPWAWVFASSPGRASTGRTAMAAANRKGVPSVMAELGGAGVVTRGVLADTERGLRRILHAFGMLPDYQPDAARGTREVRALGSIHAYDTGLFEPFRDIGEPVEEGAPVGLVHFPDAPLREPVPVVSPYTGLVLAKRAMGQVERGDAVVQIAEDIEES